MSTTLVQVGEDDTPIRFDFGVRLGLVFVVQTACLSAAAVAGLLAYIAYSAVQIRPRAVRKWSTTTHVHWYFLSMLVSELFQAVGGIINVRWVADAQVTEGGLCTTQGVVKQFGDVGVAFASLAIALHTFSVLVFRWRPDPSSKVPYIVLSLIWLFLILLVSLSLGTHKGNDYYGETQYWCWITSGFPVQRIVLEYLWLWITAFLNFILYVPVAIVIIYDASVVIHRGRVRFVRNPKTYRQDNQAEKGVAIKMLVYPAVYTMTVLPIAITRWLNFTGKSTSWSATIFSDVVFASSGFFNVIIFTATRPNLRPHREPTSRSQMHLTNSRTSTLPPNGVPKHDRSDTSDSAPNTLRRVSEHSPLTTIISPTSPTSPSDMP